MTPPRPGVTVAAPYRALETAQEATAQVMMTASRYARSECMSAVVRDNLAKSRPGWLSRGAQVIIGPFFGLLLVIVLSIVGIFVFYWIIRLAVRHGIEDARRRNPSRVREDMGWDPQRS